LLERALSSLVEDLAKEALHCFRQVKRFGMGGMLRVRFSPSLRVCVFFSHAVRRHIGNARDRVHAPDAHAIRHDICGGDAVRSI
jgi:hypothetical protein